MTKRKELNKEILEKMFCSTWINQMLEPYKAEQRQMQWEKEVRERIQKGMQDEETKIQ